MNATINTNENSHHHALCWRSILTGLLAALLGYFIFSALGAGVAGFRVAHIIARGEDGSGLMTGAGVWLGVSSVVSLFLGSYFANRVSGTGNNKVGASQGVVIAALFFAWLLHGAGNSLGSLAQLTSSFSASDFSTNSTVIVTDGDAEKAARTFADIGWVFFATFVLGTCAAVLGGYESTNANLKKPLQTHQ